MANPKVIDKGTQEYKNLEAVCAILNTLCETDTKYWVDVTYFDYGQNWKWTTILNSKGVQILSPAEWEKILFADTAIRLAEVTDEIRAGKYFSE